MADKPEQQTTQNRIDEKDRNVPVGVPICFSIGMVGGVLIGVLTGNFVLWLVVGMVGGVLVGQTVARSFGENTLSGISIYEKKSQPADEPDDDTTDR